MRGCFLGLATLVAIGLAGCGDSKSKPPANAANEAQGGPAEAVAQFLRAVQTGDDKTAANMLTSVARQKTSELELEVAPPGSPTATFEVGEVEMVDDDGAYVGSTWSDKDADGNRRDDQIVWVVRRNPEGWRIAGMVTKLFDSKLVLNFEDPEDMLRKQELAAEALQKQAEEQKNPQVVNGQQPPNTQAEKPGVPSETRLK